MLKVSKLFSFFAVLGPIACGCKSTGVPEAAATAQAEGAKLARLFDEYLDFLFRMSPSTATKLGFHEFDSRLDDLSKDSLGLREAGLSNFLHRLDSEIDRSRLSPDDRVDFERFQNELERRLFAIRELRVFQTDPLLYGELVSGPIHELLQDDFAPLEDRLKSAIARMREVPRLLEQARSNLQAPPRPHVELAIRRNRGAVEFYEEGLRGFVGGSSLAAEALAEGKKVASELRKYGDWLEKELLPKATGDWRLGRELWEKKLRLELDPSLDGEELEKAARTEYSRTREEMHAVARELWPIYYPDRALPEGERAPEETVRAVLERIAQDRSTRETLTRDVREAVTDVRIFLHRADLLTLPAPDRLEVVEMPPFRGGASPAYLDPAPPLDPERTNRFAIEPIPASWRDEEAESRLKEYNRHALRILAIHEAYPGHHVQLSWANRHPSKIRRILGNPATIEGWAVYAERMMLENGFGGSDPRLRLAQLKLYLRAVLNALIDRGLHLGELDEEAALSLLEDGGFQEKNEARGKLLRAEVTSVQLSSYFAGYRALKALREEIEAREGKRFSLKAFHDRFLAQGSAPLSAIREALGRSD